MNQPWREVEALPLLNGAVEPMLSTVDALRGAWEKSISSASPEEFTEARQRSLRRHAIETGIIERLYDLDWGVTEALVAEGITAEVASREGGVSDDAFDLMTDQLDALQYLVAAVNDGRDLSVFFIRELHQLITRHQPTYEARDALGRLVQVPLPQGDWKTQPNHVRRPDGTMLEYTPPEHVPGQLERMVELYRETEGQHPVVRAAWLHHRFICIHPFADGNGRVARALTLLVLLRGHYAPLVVDRRNRPDYIAALDKANDGDLRPLVHLFSQLQIVAMRAELERPIHIEPTSTGAVAVLRAHVDRLKEQRARLQGDAVDQIDRSIVDLHGLLRRHLQPIAVAFEETLRDLDGQARAEIDDARSQPFTYVSILAGALGSRFQFAVVVTTLRYSGVLAVEVTSRAFRPTHADNDDGIDLLEDLAPTEAVTLAPGESVDSRWPDMADLIDRTLTVAVGRFSQLLY